MISNILRSIRLYARAAALLVALALVLHAAPASAQYKPRPLNDPATGEQFHIEASAAFWFPTTDLQVSSESLGIGGTVIDFKKDLGLVDQRLPQLSLVLRPARKHKLRAQYIPIKFTQTGTLTRDVVFNGQRYRVGLPVTSTLDWKAYRFSYEYDFIVKNSGFAGFILEAKYTDVQVQLDALSGSTHVVEFAHATAPIPAIGGIARVYVVPNISITGEVTGFSVPQSLADKYAPGASAHYVDIDVYGTLNFTNNIGVQGGYRSMDLGYNIKPDTGTFVLRGIYVGAVLRY